MKTSSPLHWVACGLALPFVPHGLAGAEGSPAVAGEPAPYTLFMGMDLSVEQDKEFYHVEAINSDAFLVKIIGRQQAISTREASLQLMMARVVKLAQASASVTKLSYKRAYTPVNDPFQKFQNSARLNDIANSSSDAAVMNGASTLQYLQGHNLTGDVAYTMNRGADQQIRNARGLADISTNSSMDRNSEVAAGKFDAVDVSFEVAAEKPLAHPYVIMVARFREANGSAGKTGDWIYAGALDPIGRESKKVHVLRGGLPPGFELENFQLHLYDHDTEIATNVASNRTELTRDEAFKYLAIDYSMQHKGATLPATPAQLDFPSDFRTRVPAAELGQTFYVQVSKDAKVSGVFLDAACSRPVDNQYLVAAVRNIRFNPELNKGRLVDGVASLTVGQ